MLRKAYVATLATVLLCIAHTPRTSDWVGTLLLGDQYFHIPSFTTPPSPEQSIWQSFKREPPSHLAVLPQHRCGNICPLPSFWATTCAQRSEEEARFAAAPVGTCGKPLLSTYRSWPAAFKGHAASAHFAAAKLRKAGSKTTIGPLLSADGILLRDLPPPKLLSCQVIAPTKLNSSDELVLRSIKDRVPPNQLAFLFKILLALCCQPRVLFAAGVSASSSFLILIIVQLARALAMAKEVKQEQLRQIHDLKIQLDAARAVEVRLLIDLNISQNMIAVQRNEVLAKTAEYQQLEVAYRLQVVGAERSAGELQAELAGVRARVEATERELARLRIESCTWDAQCVALEEELSALRLMHDAECDELQGCNMELRENITALQGQLSAAHAGRAALRCQLEGLSERYDVCQRDLDELNGELGGAREEVDELRRALDTQKEVTRRVQERLTVQEAYSAEVEREAGEWHAAARVAEQCGGDLLARLRPLGSALAELMAASTTRVAEMQQQVEQRDKEIAGYREQVSAYERVLEALNRKVFLSQQDVRRLQDRLRCSGEQYRCLHARVMVAEADARHARSSAETSSRELSAMKRRISSGDVLEPITPSSGRSTPVLNRLRSSFGEAPREELSRSHDSPVWQHHHHQQQQQQGQSLEPLALPAPSAPPPSSVAALDNLEPLVMPSPRGVPWGSTPPPSPAPCPLPVLAEEPETPMLHASTQLLEEREREQRAEELGRRVMGVLLASHARVADAATGHLVTEASPLSKAQPRAQPRAQPHIQLDAQPHDSDSAPKRARLDSLGASRRVPRSGAGDSGRSGEDTGGGGSSTDTEQQGRAGGADTRERRSRSSAGGTSARGKQQPAAAISATSLPAAVARTGQLTPHSQRSNSSTPGSAGDEEIGQVAIALGGGAATACSSEADIPLVHRVGSAAAPATAVSVAVAAAKVLTPRARHMGCGASDLFVGSNGDGGARLAARALTPRGRRADASSSTSESAGVGPSVKDMVAASMDNGTAWTMARALTPRSMYSDGAGGGKGPTGQGVRDADSVEGEVGCLRARVMTPRSARQEGKRGSADGTTTDVGIMSVGVSDSGVAQLVEQAFTPRQKCTSDNGAVSNSMGDGGDIMPVRPRSSADSASICFSDTGSAWARAKALTPRGLAAREASEAPGTTLPPARAPLAPVWGVGGGSVPARGALTPHGLVALQHGNGGVGSSSGSAVVVGHDEEPSSSMLAAAAQPCSRKLPRLPIPAWQLSPDSRVESTTPTDGESLATPRGTRPVNPYSVPLPMAVPVAMPAPPDRAAPPRPRSSDPDSTASVPTLGLVVGSGSRPARMRCPEPASSPPPSPSPDLSVGSGSLSKYGAEPGSPAGPSPRMDSVDGPGLSDGEADTEEGDRKRTRTVSPRQDPEGAKTESERPGTEQCVSSGGAGTPCPMLFNGRGPGGGGKWLAFCQAVPPSPALTIGIEGGAEVAMDAPAGPDVLPSPPAARRHWGSRSGSPVGMKPSSFTFQPSDSDLDDVPSVNLSTSSPEGGIYDDDEQEDAGHQAGSDGEDADEDDALAQVVVRRLVAGGLNAAAGAGAGRAGVPPMCGSPVLAASAKCTA